MRFSPSRLHAPPRWLRRLLAPIWMLLLLGAVVGQVGGSWRVITNHLWYDAPFAALGLKGEQGAYVEGAGNLPETKKIEIATQLAEIDGKPVPADISYEAFARRVAGPMGSAVTLSYYDDDGELYDIRLMRSSANAEAVSPLWHTLLDPWLVTALELIAAGIGLWVSVLMWRRRDDGVSFLLSFGLIGLVLSASQVWDFLSWIDLDPLPFNLIMTLGPVLGTTCLVAVIPAFPDGVYRPRWSGLLLIVAPIVGLLNFSGGVMLVLSDRLPDGALTLSFAISRWVSWLSALIVLTACVAAVLRYRATPPGIERQKVKWAALAIVVGLGASALANLVLYRISLEGPAGVGVEVGRLVLIAFGNAVIPLGLLASLSGWRPNDADGAIGRSAAYAALTLLIGAIWAASTTWLDKLVGDAVTPAAAAGISTAVAAAIFVPTRERLLGWAERRFQPALVKLRGLPAKLRPLKIDHDPAEVGRGTLLAIVNGIQARSAALVLECHGDRRVIATYETSVDAVLLDLDAAPPDRVFPVHHALCDLMGTVGYLLIGPRSDGASYNPDEKKAIGLVLGPIAEVLRATSRRAARVDALAAMLTSVDARVAGLEALRARR